MKQSSSSVPSAQAADVILIDSRQMMRDCLAVAIQGAEFALSVAAHGDIDALQAVNLPSGGRRIALIAGQPGRSAVLADDIRSLLRDFDVECVVALCADGGPAAMVEALQAGAKATVPADASLDVLLGVMRLVLAGGTYAPSSALHALDEVGGGSAAQAGQAGRPTEPGVALTRRQAAVVEALCRGKPNKLIAYELNMCESTVKVHLRTLMKKMQARSRTHLATMLGQPSPAGLHLQRLSA